MRFNHPLAANIFTRLTSLSAEASSNRIENLCTESLAWCLLQSSAFQREFFQLMGIPFVDCEVHTQRGFSRTDEANEHGCFDLLLLSHDGVSLAVAIEAKVWSGFGKHQIAKYRQALNTQYDGFQKTMLVSLTPFHGRPQGVDSHVQWGRVNEALKRVSSEPHQVIFSQFTDFLDSRGLKCMKLDKLDDTVLKGWHSVSALQTQWTALFGMFANDDNLRRIFKRGTERPIVDSSDSGSWFGIWSPDTSPWIYAGFGVTKTGVGILTVELVVLGTKADASKMLPNELLSPFQEANPFLDEKVYQTANFGKNAEDGNTYFEFIKVITAELDGQSEKILEWFKATVMAVSVFASEHCA